MVLIPDRLANTAIEILEFSLKHYEITTDECPVPPYSDQPDVVYDNDDDLLNYLEHRAEEEYQAYWRSVGASDAEMAALFYTTDEALIGLFVLEETLCLKPLENIVPKFGIQFGYMSGNEVPPRSAKEFIDITRRSELPRVIEGNVFG